MMRSRVGLLIALSFINRRRTGIRPRICASSSHRNRDKPRSDIEGENRRIRHPPTPCFAFDPVAQAAPSPIERPFAFLSDATGQQRQFATFDAPQGDGGAVIDHRINQDLRVA